VLTLRAIYDPETDILYLRLSEAPIEESESIEPNLLVDRDAQGRVVAIEVLWASTLEGANPHAMTFEVRREAVPEPEAAE
jgi:uncharacterized protein YuzE